MTQSRASDLKMVLIGIRKVARASLRQQEAYCNLRWQASNLKEIVDEVAHKLKTTVNEACEDRQRFAERVLTQGRITVQKASMIPEGIKEFSRYTIQNRTTPETVQEPSSSGSPEWAKSILFEADLLRQTAGDSHRTEHHAETHGPFPETNHGQHTNPLPNETRAEYGTLASSAASQERPLEEQLMQNVSPKPQVPNPFPTIVSAPHISTSIENLQPNFRTTNLTNVVMDKANSEQQTVSRIPVREKLEHMQQLSDRSRERKVPSSQIGRLFHFGGLVAGIGVGTLAAATKKTLGLGQENTSIVLNDANIERIVNTLCRVRGAALKIGQMLSLQDDSIMSPRLQKVFERVRQSADFMPVWQAEKVLKEELGDDWKSKVASFESRPFAAASIGQVHLAVLHDGRKVAVKIQYPGVADSIDSDIKNLTSTLKLWNILPEGLFINHLMAAARRELALEVNYHYEASCGKKFKELLKPYPQYFVPEVIDELSRQRVITTELIDGLALDKCFNMDQETRDKIGKDILHLCLLELCTFRVMQTDPNWSNFFYDPTTRRMSLLDFGATREFSKSFVDKYLRVINAAICRDKELIFKTSEELGILTGYESKLMKDAHAEGVLILGEAFSYNGEFDFGTQDTVKRIEKVIPIMIEHRLTPPPEEIYSLHRKLAGIFLLFTKLRAKINCKLYYENICSQYEFEK